MNWIDEVNKEESLYTHILSFHDYMKVFAKSPLKELRPTNIYLKDMFDFFGTSPQGAYNLFHREHSECPPVHGQYQIQKKIYQLLKNFSEEGFNNKFILLIGPNGSSKSSLIKKMMLSAEDYSQTDEGALYSFSWIFPIDNFVKGSLGLSGKDGDKNLTTYAQLEDKEISAIISSELRDHPLLLVPTRTRQKLINDHLKSQPERLESVKKSYLYNGDLTQKNKLIFDALLKNYKGNFEEVLKHIRVERFTINRRYSIGATTIEPQLHVDAQLHQITMDRRLANLPPSLQSLNLFNLSGEIVLANRGILEFSDLLKRPLDTFKYLLMTMESKTINLQGILTELDTFFIGSSNEIHFSAFKQHPDFNSFKGRFHFLKVPYLVNFLFEEKIYQDQINNLKDQAHFEPHALQALCMWSVMSRLRASQSKNYQDEKIGKIAEALTPLEKTLYYATGEAPEYFDLETRQVLKNSLTDIINEFDNDQSYEGKFGISPREVKQIIYDISYHHKFITYVEILDYLKEFCEKKSDYDFLNIAPQGDFHHYDRFMHAIEHYLLDVLDSEVRDSLGLVDDRSYEDYICRYILNINSLLKGDKIKNPVTGKFENADTFFIKEFENNIQIQEAPEKFRSQLIARLGAFALDNPGKPIVYCHVFDDLSYLLQDSFRKEQKRIIEKIGNNLMFYIAETKEEQKSNLTEETKKIIQSLLHNLTTKYKYSQAGAISSLQHLIKMRYSPSP